MRNTSKSTCNNSVVNPCHQLAMANLDLIDKVMATNKTVRSCTFIATDDFFQSGYEVLYKAAKCHNTNGEASYRTYAARALSNHFYDMARLYEKTIKRNDFTNNLYIDSIDEMMALRELNQEEMIMSDDLSDEENELYWEIDQTNQATTWVKELIQEANLSEREMTILSNKYDIQLMEEPLSTKQLAEKYHMTTQSVNRICRETLDKLRNVPKTERF